MILHYCHGFKYKYLRSVGKKERIMGERLTGKDRYSYGSRAFLQMPKILMLRTGVGKRIYYQFHETPDDGIVCRNIYM
jgi:hypothetical protein